MQPITVLCAGMSRSASVWSFNAVRHALALGDDVTQVEAGLHEGEELAELLRTPARCHRIIRCRLDTDLAWRAIRAIDLGVVQRIVYTRRDPMTSLASLLEHFGGGRRAAAGDGGCDLGTAIDRITTDVEVDRLLRGRFAVTDLDVHADGEPACLDTLLADLGVSLTPAQHAEILAEYSFARMRERCLDIAHADPRVLLNGHLDPVTLLHPHHVMQGRARDWTTQLSVEQITRACIALAEHDAGPGAGHLADPDPAEPELLTLGASDL